MKKISFVICCYNEENNVEPLAQAIILEMDKISKYDYEIIFADNASKDNTQKKLKELSKKNRRIKVIINNRNVGVSKSGKNAWRHTTGDAVLSMVCDFQDPPELIPRLIELWENGCYVVMGQKIKSKESKFKYLLRSIYYKIIAMFSDVPQYDHVTGFGIYDRKVADQLNVIQEEIPSRYLIAEMGFDVTLLPYTQAARKSGKSSYNIWRYFDFAVSSLVKTSLLPLRLATIAGSIASFFSFFIGLIYLIFKLTHWDRFDAGVAPLVIGLFFLGSIQLLFIGIVGEYIGILFKRTSKIPAVVERELINFDEN